MDDEFAVALVLGFFTGALLSILLCLSTVPTYKQGQLDYQAGKIKWTVIEGQVHHIEAKK